MWIQKTLILQAYPRGFHLITEQIIGKPPELQSIQTGLLHLFIQHTSASISINENADPSVRKDLESFFNQLIPEQSSYFTHTLEGPDDMPAHIKASLLGNSLTIPIADGQLQLGTWQGVYLGEHRNHAGPRTLQLTVNGQATE